METFLPLFLSIAQSAIKFLWEFVLTWWWLFLPVMLLGLFKHFWLWLRIDKFLSEKRWQVLEIRVPGEIDNPFRRMESVFAGIWQIKIRKNKKKK